MLGVLLDRGMPRRNRYAPFPRRRVAHARRRERARMLEPALLPRPAASILALVLIVSGLPYALRFLVTMATSSLWTDELYTIQNFSGRGPFITVTDYHAPNNHILFNLLNSVLPRATSVEPLRARLLSLIAVSFILAAAVYVFWRRGAALAGGVFFVLFAVNPNYLDLMLQARGYGLASAFAFALVYFLLRFAESPSPGYLTAMAMATVLGGWTVPTFAFFAAPLWLVFGLWQRQARVVLAASLAGWGLALVYSPVLFQLLSHARGYGAQWGRDFATLEGVAESIKIYVANSGTLGIAVVDRDLVLFGALLALGSLVGLRREDSLAATARVTLLAVVCFFAICLVLRTPLIRSTSFIVVPLVFGSLLLATSLVRTLPKRQPALIVGASLLALVAVLAASRHAIHMARSFSFLPEEDWKTMAQILADTLPEGTSFGAKGEIGFLKGYLRPGYTPVPIDGSPGATSELFLECPVTEPRVRFDGRVFAPAKVEFRLPQRRARYQSLWLTPPQNCSLSGAHAADGRDVRRLLCDRDPETSFANVVRVKLDVRRRYRSLVLLEKRSDRAFPASALAVVSLAENSKILPIGAVHHEGDVTLANLGDQRIRALVISPSPGVGISEAWVYPVPDQ